MRRSRRPSSPLENSTFRRWFGDSVVVDDNGEPLVVYHGTDDDDFKSFRAEALPRGGRKGRLLGEGFYFTSDPDQAARWGRHVIAAYLRIENPRTQRGGLLVPASSDQDGTIAAGAPGTRDGEVWFVVKSPYQIKSATDNDGSFDPDDADLTSNPDPSSPLENPAFRRWFGDSVVVDDDGEPLVVYHGTDKSFDVFKARSRSVNSTTFGPVDTERSGIFVSDNPEFSREFGRRLLPLYARIENPAEINRDTALYFAETIDPFGSERDLWLLARHVSLPWELFEGELGPRFIAYLRKFAHDGATFIEDVPKGDDVGEDEQEYVEGRTYVVFDPRQIKSATDNDGSFDPENPDVRRNIRKNPARTLSADETANEYDRGRSNDFLTGGCLDWAQAYIDHVGGTLVGVFVNGSMEHVMVKDGKFVVDAVGVHRPSAVVSWFKKSWKTKDVKLSEPRWKDLRLLETDDDRYADAFADVYNEYNQDPRFRG